MASLTSFSFGCSHFEYLTARAFLLESLSVRISVRNGSWSISVRKQNFGYGHKLLLMLLDYIFAVATAQEAAL